LGARVVEVPRDPNTFEVRAREVVEAASSARVVCLTSPNNPTGTLVDPEPVREVCAACPGIVLADEAYMEFAAPGASARPLLDECDNLVVLHTFSKAFCLAGARVGYVLANPGIISALAAVRQPYSVSSLDQAAALAVMGRRDAMAPVITSIVDQRELVREELAKLPGATVWPSAANFLFVRLPLAHEVWERLRDEHSILVRDFSAKPGLQDCLRVTVGRPEDNDALLGALGTLLG
jgi:histidinol-phosphate aminotransferase